MQFSIRQKLNALVCFLLAGLVLIAGGLVYFLIKGPATAARESDLILSGLLIGFLSMLIAISLALTTRRNINRRIKNLMIANSLLESGNYSEFVDLKWKDELGELTTAFNSMAVEGERSKQELKTSLQNYKLLFENNPMPMWIIAESTLEIIDVNNAAMDFYGYSREEFLKLNLRDLGPADEVEKYIGSINLIAHKEYAGIWRHKRRDGTVIMAEILGESVIYKAQRARLILANDVTEKLKSEAELISHTIMQQEIMTEIAIDVQEKEREELARELHDNVNQILASTKLYLELALTGSADQSKDAISKSYENLTLAINEIRQLSRRLVPPSLGTTLAEALQDLIDEIKAVAHIKMTLTIAKFRETLLNDNIKLMLYRIVQEQINNIIKHAAAGRVQVNLETTDDTLKLVVTDDGVGFDPTKKSKGIGLRNIENRVSFYNGTTHINSIPGSGTTLEVLIPL